MLEIDARGQRCPMPVVMLARAASNVELGTELILLADDPAASTDVPAWCRLRHQELVAADPVPDEPAATRFRVRILTPQPPLPTR